uniref:Neurotransmitter-gated ion-channel ligand-binding domain-containing protein n=1 Tax=Parascaris univalens TaxID=6257 RepID=A0A915CGQ9_PARUN
MTRRLVVLLLLSIGHNFTWANGKNISKQEESGMKSLYAYLFEDYQKDLRPVLNDSTTTIVTLKFWLKQVLKVDERDQIVNVYCWLELYWVDELLKWDPLKFGGLRRIHVPSNKIWKP